MVSCFWMQVVGRRDLGLNGFGLGLMTWGLGTGVVVVGFGVVEFWAEGLGSKGCGGSSLELPQPGGAWIVVHIWPAC